MELKITDDKVREAAEICGDVKRALKVLFPEAFGGPVKPKGIDLSKLAIDSSCYTIFDSSRAKAAGFHSNLFMQVRTSGEHRNRAFFLDPTYKWTLVNDSAGLCLVPEYKY